MKSGSAVALPVTPSQPSGLNATALPNSLTALQLVIPSIMAIVMKGPCRIEMIGLSQGGE